MIFLIFNQLIYLELYAISFWGFIYRRHGCNYFQKLNIDLQTAQQMSSKIINELFAPAIEDIKNAAGKFPDRVGQGGASATRPTMPQPPPPPQMKNAPPINQGNVIDLRVNSNS